MPNGELEPLSERELELVQLLGQGLSNREIAQKLFISPNTVKVHLRNIYTKLGVSSRTEATMVALRQGLIEIELPGQEGPAVMHAPEGDVEPTPDAQPEIIVQPAPPLHLWQRIYLVASILLVALSLWLIWPRTVQQLDPFPERQPVNPAPSPGTASRWKALAQLSKPRRRLAAVAQGNRVFAIGGEAADGITGAVEIYDADTDDWIPGVVKPSPAADIGATTLDKRIYVPGGSLTDGTVSNQLEIYIPEQNGPGRWTTGAPMPRPLSAYASAAYNGTLYLFGGRDDRSYSAETYRYDPDADEWSVLSPLPAPRAYAGAGTIGDRIYVVGGYDGQNELDTCQAYDPLQDQWEVCPSLNAPRGGVGVAVVGETLYVIGGGWKSYLVGNEYLTVSSETPSWQTFPSPLLEEWRNLAVAANGTFIYAIGGWDGDFLAVNQAYRALFRVYLPSLEGQDNATKPDTVQK